jgi:predicted GNAT family N-acyltransferase
MNQAGFSGGEWNALPVLLENIPELQALCNACSDFFEIVTGVPPGPTEAQVILDSLPDGFDLSTQSKHVLGIRSRDGNLIGVLDCLENYPEDGIWIVGLLLLHPNSRGQGLGRSIIREFTGWSGAKRVRGGVLNSNQQVIAFWQNLGFEILSEGLSLTTMEMRPGD